MSTYAQWRAAIDRGDLRRVTWVCGEQRILVEEVVDITRRLVDVSDLDYFPLTVGEVNQHAVWAILGQYISGSRRLVVVRNAEVITHWEPLESWLADKSLSGVYVVFVSGEDDVTHTTVEKKREVAPHLATMMARRRHAVVVRCATPNPTDAITWVKRRGGALDDTAAERLLIRTGGDLTAAAAVADKLALFEGIHIGPETVDQLCDQRSADSFAEALVMLRKRDAIFAASSMSEHDYGKAIGLLDARLDQLAGLNHHLRAGSHPREMTGVPHWFARAYMPVAKHYDPQRCAHSRRVLAVVDDARLSGARDGLMEALVALW